MLTDGRLPQKQPRKNNFVAASYRPIYTPKNEWTKSRYRHRFIKVCRIIMKLQIKYCSQMKWNALIEMNAAYIILTSTLLLVNMQRFACSHRSFWTFGLILCDSFAIGVHVHRLLAAAAAASWPTAPLIGRTISWWSCVTLWASFPRTTDRNSAVQSPTEDQNTPEP